MLVHCKPYLLNPKLSEYPNLRIRVNAAVRLTTGTVGMGYANMIVHLERVNVQLVDIVQHQTSASYPLSALIALWESENFVSTIETLLQRFTKNDGTKLDNGLERITVE